MMVVVIVWEIGFQNHQCFLVDFLKNRFFLRLLLKVFSRTHLHHQSLIEFEFADSVWDLTYSKSMFSTNKVLLVYAKINRFLFALLL